MSVSHVDLIWNDPRAIPQLGVWTPAHIEDCTSQKRVVWNLFRIFACSGSSRVIRALVVSLPLPMVATSSHPGS